MDAEIVKASESGLPSFTKKDKKDAEVLKKKIDDVVSEISGADAALLKGYVRLGYLCKEVEDKKFWVLWHYNTFNDFVCDVGTQVRKKRSRIYNSIGVARYLLPYASEKQLEDMGITKANSLAGMVRTTGKVPSEAIIKAGIENPIAEYEAMLAKEFKVYDTKPDERWRNLGGSWWSDEEWKTYQQAYDTVRDVLVADGSIKKETPEHIQFKMIILAMSQEVIGSWTPMNTTENS